MRLKTALVILVYPFLSRQQKAVIASQIAYERAVYKIMSVLPGHYPYERVDKALEVSGVEPSMVYMSLASGESTVVLVQFFAALSKKVCTSDDFSADWQEEKWW